MWRENLRPASFKGVNFYVEDHEAEIGRRLFPNEYPFRDVPFTEDLGRRARRYNVSAYLVGDNYMTARDQLMDLIEEGGAGTLVHPYLGTKTVICETARLRESQKEGGFILVSMVFIEAGKKQFPDSSPVPKDLVFLRSEELITEAKTDFINQIIVDGVPEWVRSYYSNALQDAGAIFDTIRTSGGINNQSTTALLNQAATWVADVADLGNPTISVIKNVSNTAAKIQSIFDGIFDLAPNTEISTKNLNRFVGFSAPRSASTTAQATIANNNAQATESYIQVLSVSNEAKAIVSRTFPSYEEAVAGREDILTRIDTLAGATKNDNIYEAMRGLRAEVANAIPGELNSLPRLDTVNLKQSTPSIVLAYDLYESVDQELDLINRNKIRHPGFMPGGGNINVLRYDTDTA